VTRRWRYFIPLGVALLLVSGCTAVQASPTGIPSALDPHGPAAARLANLWWVMFSFGTIIFLAVIGLLAAAILRQRRATSDTPPDSSGGDTGRRWPIWGGIIMPFIVLAIVFGYNIFTLAAVESPLGKAPVKIEIVGRRWWWEVKYPDQGIVTANEIHIPVGVPVEIKLQSADVIHSFWVPELHGKMDLIPTRTNFLNIQADKPGVYRGQCAEFCGLQHAKMGLLVIAESQDEFDKWSEAQQQPAATPADPTALQGQQAFMQVGCVFCHTVRGLDDKEIDRSSIDLGPDLTHIASRQTIAGASLENNPGNLSGWIVNAQHTKPGSLMPTFTSLSSEDLQALLAYLETLH
jgi:cytochrome c oxidase subunit 2